MAIGNQGKATEAQAQLKFMQCFPNQPLLKGASATTLDGTPHLPSYDHFIVAFSGGKDSIACVLHLLDQGIAPAQIELWHHSIDGREGETPSFQMDWPCTPSYCKAFAKHFGLPIFFSWREGGFARELSRNLSATAPVTFEHPKDNHTTSTTKGGKGPKNTRLKFPQVCADLSKRWCSAYLKIDVCSLALRNQSRFLAKQTLILTGERAEESASRAKYSRFEVDRTDARKGKLQRHVDHWRPIHGWSEQQVWDSLKAHRVIPPPAYRLGWSRLSCLFCIFGNANQWASAQHIAPQLFAKVADMEQQTGLTIHRKLSVQALADKGTPYAALKDTDLTRKVLSTDTWDEPIIYPTGVEPTNPAGAFANSCGPT